MNLSQDGSTPADGDVPDVPQVGPRRKGCYAHIPDFKFIELRDQNLSYAKIGKLLEASTGAARDRLRKLGKRTARKKVTDAELEDCRLDPAWEARQGVANRLVCRNCGEWQADIHQHLRKEKMLPNEYRRKWPGARLKNFKVSADSAASLGRPKTAQQYMEAFAAKYLTAAELRECRLHPDWEDKHGLDCIVCRKCGLKLTGVLSRHLKDMHENCSLASYDEDFPKARTMPPRLRSHRNEAERKRRRDLRKDATQVKPLRARVRELEQRLAEAKGIDQQTRELKNLTLIESVAKKIANPLTHMWMSPAEVAVALGISLRSFYREKKSYSELIPNSKGWYSTASVNKQLTYPPRKRF